MRNSPSDLKPPSRVASSGTSTKMATTARNTALNSTAGSNGMRVVSALLTAHEPSLVRAGKGNEDRGQNDTEGTAIAYPHAGDAVIVEEAYHRVRGIRRSPARQRHDQVEQLQRADDGEEYGEPDRRMEQWDDDMAQSLRPRRAVDAGGLDQALVEALERRDEQHHVEAKVLPDDHDQHGQHRRVGRGQK